MSTIRKPKTKVIEHVPLEKIHPDPRNRNVRVPDCAELADSLQAHGQQQPIKLRPAGDEDELPVGHYVIVFGERRWRAAQIAGWQTIAAVITQIDRAEALQLIAVENSQRREINDLERGRLIQQLTDGREHGGAALSVKEAAATLGLAESSARNCTRLLQLPRHFQQRIVSGEMPASFARAVLPVAHVREVVTELEKVWKQERGQFTRSEWEEEVIRVALWRCGPMEKETSSARPFLRADAYNRLFEPTPQQLEQLEVFTLTADGERYQLAANRRLYDQLQEAAYQAQLEQLEKNQKPSAKNNGQADTKPKTKAELRRQRAEQKAQLAKRIDQWRMAFLRERIAERLQTPAEAETAALCVLWWLVAGTISSAQRERAARAALLDIGTAPPACNWISPQKWLELFTASGKSQLDQLRRFARHVLLDPRTEIPGYTIEQIAARLAIDIEREWRQCQQSTRRPPVFTRFFELHTSEQLEELAAELGVNLFGAETKGARVKKFTTAARRLPLPKNVRPVLTSKPKRRAKRKAK